MSLVRVRLGDVVVGTIERFDDELDTHVFQWSDAYRLTPHRPVLGQYLEDRLTKPVTTHGLTPWFEHLLPQGNLRGAIAREAQVDDTDGLALLAWLGHDLPGAVEVEVVQSLRARPRRVVAGAPLSSPYRASLPGAQWKLSLRSTAKGLTLPVRGQDGDWIAKFHASEYPRITSVEHATMDWAARAGLDVPEHRLVTCDDIEALPADVPRGDGVAYTIRRFDRTPSGRCHGEDFGQVLDRPPGPRQYQGAYEEIAAVLGAMCPEDAREFVRRLVFCCLAGNGDAHLKNWGLRYADGRHARLSPAYDLVATVVYPHVARELALSLGGSKSFESLVVERFDGVARALSLSADQVRAWVREDAEKIREFWQSDDLRDQLSAYERSRIDAHLASVSLR